MGESDWVKFLGTAGARFVMASQVRHSAGTLVRLGGRSVMLDPGPGTLVRCAASRPKIDAASLDAIILTHAHMDHSGDLNVLIDAMTEGGWKKRGALFAPRDCMDGENRVLLHYLRNAPALMVPLEAQRDYELDGVRFATSVRHRHSVETYGIRFRRAQGDVSFVVDTQYFDGLAESYRGSSVLVVNVVLKDARTDDRVLHLSLPEAERLIREVSPRKAVLTHFGMTMVKAKPWELAGEMSSRLGIEVIAASDGITLELGEA
jgi:ribonuclease BN (tRNA processing enzyme)